METVRILRKIIFLEPFEFIIKLIENCRMRMDRRHGDFEIGRKESLGVQRTDLD